MRMRGPVAGRDWCSLSCWLCQLNLRILAVRTQRGQPRILSYGPYCVAAGQHVNKGWRRVRAQTASASNKVAAAGVVSRESFQGIVSWPVPAKQRTKCVHDA